MAFGETRETSLDLTLVLDPAEAWPDAEACPDWPLRPMQTASGHGVVGEAAAKEQLELLQQHLGRNAELRPPTESERATLRSRYFRDYDPEEAGGQGRNIGPWSTSLGLRGFTWRDRSTEAPAQQMVEALHIRGYLRKLEERRARQAAGAQQQARDVAQAKLDRYERTVVGLGEELSGLLEAEARHKQQLEDEKAARRCFEIRQVIDGAYREAVRAAADLGVDPPDPPKT
ncbi:hypothetical protein [Phenylobacterium sp.]|uniref:hypothetical protein n=1 Tax=Phenylobacterium sp. TaxID=1871053 RepID=UPI0035B21CA4